MIEITTSSSMRVKAVVLRPMAKLLVARLLS
jgi:hypothetical protein